MKYFLFLDQIFMLFMYENKKNSYQFFPASEECKGVKFHFCLGTMRAIRETGDSRAVTSMQEC